MNLLLSIFIKFKQKNVSRGFILQICESEFTMRAILLWHQCPWTTNRRSKKRNWPIEKSLAITACHPYRIDIDCQTIDYILWKKRSFTSKQNVYMHDFKPCTYCLFDIQIYGWILCLRFCWSSWSSPWWYLKHNSFTFQRSHKEWGPHVVALLNGTSIYEWCIPRLVVKNERQKNICYKDIELHAEN